MKTILFAALFCATINANSAEKIISDTDFSASLSSVKEAVAQTKNENLKISFSKVGNYVELRDYVTLSGNFWVPENGGFVSTQLTGWAQLSSLDGKIKTENKYISAYVSFWAKPNQYIFQTVYPNVSFSVYKDNKYIGTAYSRDSFTISGFVSGNFANISTNGYMTASIYVEEEK